METRLLAAAPGHAAATNSRACLRDDTSRLCRTIDCGRPLSMSNGSPAAAAFFSWALKESASARVTNGWPNRRPSTVQRTR